MQIERDTAIGKVKVELPVNIGDVILQGRTKYSIDRIIVFSDEIFLVNSTWGLWIKIDEVELVEKTPNAKYFKIKNKEETANETKKN